MSRPNAGLIPSSPTRLAVLGMQRARSTILLLEVAPALLLMGTIAAAPTAGQGLPVLLDEQALVLQYASVSMPTGGGMSALVAGDLDADGDLDLLSAHPMANQVRLLLNERGTFTQVTFNPGLMPSALALADVDGDVDLDVVVGLDSQIRLLRNDGSGHLSVQPPVSLPPGDTTPIAIHLVDVDGDLELDAVIGLSHHSLPSGSWTGGLIVARGDGTGAFSLLPTHALAWPAHRLDLADFDGDGWLDAAEMGGYISGTSINIAFGSAGGTFTNDVVSYPAGLYASGFTVGDWDGDGDVDLASGGKYYVTCLLNDGSGQFTSGQTLNIGAYVKGLAAGDLDRDGDIDLLGTSGSAAALRLLHNDGSGKFSIASSLKATNQTSVVLLADTSGDGYLDPWAGDVVTGMLAHGASQCLVARYGSAKASSLGCLPTMSVLGTPTLGASDFVVQAVHESPAQPALVLAGLAPQVVPGLGGQLLVQPPWFQLVTYTSAGSGDPTLCDGVVSLPIAADALAALGTGTRVYLQVLTSDHGLPSPPFVSLSDGLWFEVAP